MGSNMKGPKRRFLDKTFAKARLVGVHLLPFSQLAWVRGFVLSDYTRVDPLLGTWEDVDALGEQYYFNV